jgi:hypothetical protein
LWAAARSGGGSGRALLASPSAGVKTSLTLHDATDGKAFSNAPVGCIWRTQVDDGLQWVQSFLEGRSGAIERVFRVDSYTGAAMKVVIGGDASPWGFGSWIAVDGVIKQYYSIGISRHDLTLCGHEEGSHEGQQTWEALNLLIALRVWKSWWQAVRVTLHVRADNISAPRLVSTLRAPARNLRIIGREMALDLGDGSFAPDWTVHVPGVAHEIADALSRQFQPGVSFTLPAELAAAAEVFPPPRPLSWWRSLTRHGSGNRP